MTDHRPSSIGGRAGDLQSLSDLRRRFEQVLPKGVAVRLAPAPDEETVPETAAGGPVAARPTTTPAGNAAETNAGSPDAPSKGDGEAPAAKAVAELWPIEAEAVATALGRRRAEFAIGRQCARRALAAVGAEPAAIPVGESREPVWPHGFTGSISHTRGLVAAVASPTTIVRSIGIDIERERSVTEDLVPQILTDREQEQHRRHPERDLATLIFSAKETVYKTTFPVSRHWLGFEDATVTIDPETGVFSAVISPSADHPMAGLTLSGRVFRALGHVITSSSL